MYEPSFIDEDSLRKLSTGQFIMEMSDPEINRLKELKNLDLSEVDFSGKSISVKRDFDGWEINNVIFSRFNSESSDKKYLYGLSFKGAKMDRVSFVQAFLDRCNFECPITDNQQHNIIDLNQIDFFFSELKNCRFCGSTLENVDFRYSKISDCSMRNIKVTYGDFYFSNFKGCSAFQGSIFEKCSFTNAVFENAVIRWGSIEGILQDDIKVYRKVVSPDSNWYRHNPCGTSVEPPNDEGIRAEAIEMYKQLSGIYAGKGLNKDSNEAYAKMKEKERSLVLASIWASIKNHSFRNFWKNIIQLIECLFVFALGYGYKWLYVGGWYVFLIMIGAVMFCHKSIENVKSLCDCTCDCSKTMEIVYKGVTYSIFNSVGSYIPEYVCVVGSFYANIQTVLSFLLIGYLGFIFANKMRNNL